MAKRSKDLAKSIVYIGPSILVLSIIAVFPTMYAFITGFWSWHLHRPLHRVFLGLENYLTLFQDLRFLNSFGITILFTFTTVMGTMVLGFLLALLVWKPFPGKNIALAFLTIPMIMTPVVSALIWKVFFFESDVGLINWFLSIFSIQGPAWVATTPWAFIAIAIVNIWFMTPFVLLILEAAVSGIPKEPMEAAAIDGAGYWRRIWYIVLPMLKGTILFVLIFRITIDYRTFEVGYANAGAILMMLAVGIICLSILNAATRKRGERWMSK